MANSDNEQQILSDHAREEMYKRMFPLDVPAADATEDQLAHWAHRVQKVMTTPSYDDGRG